MLTNLKVWGDGVRDGDGKLVILVFMQKMNSEQERRYSSLYAKGENMQLNISVYIAVDNYS